ncbi:MAG: hypothetical protein K2H17_09130 [Duncaniella sp.]|uniref:hypothetical protein n=1 Tax=Duncaniella sp. TaxID=2518496 RepID=UPI0023CF17C9|nr:hypothetical protein [Duncaniella sp.]MDE5989548.1 hypothetical protein [Duncaniella sp.]
MVFFISLGLAVCIAFYTVAMMNRLIELKGVEHLWLIMLLKDNTFIDMIKYVPLLVGLAIGVAQMAPEMTQKRLKLTLHLPYPQRRLVGLMLLAGLAELLVVYLLQAMIIMVYDFRILPVELVGRVMLTTLPWYFAGFTAYLFVTAVCLEGTWRRRIILSLLGIAVLMMYFLQPALEAYNGMVLLIVITVVLLAVLSFGSIIRFKEGRQD